MVVFCRMLSLLGEPIRVQGHRGSRGTHFENTIPAILEALDAGADSIEIDLQPTSDLKVVVFHDLLLSSRLVARLDQVPFEEKALSQVNLTELGQFGYGFSKNLKFPKQKGKLGTKIPTLEEVFELLKKRKLGINLELKRDPKREEIDPALFADLVVNIVSKFGFEKRVYYSSFDLELLRCVKQKDPRAILGLIVESEDFELNELIEKGKEIKASILSPHHSVLTGPIIKAIQKEGFRIVPWTVNDPLRWQELIDMGIDEIITDYPRKLVESLRR
ncbi:MAG: hypothetical protein A3E80_06825 [Chlamydiae bacterium RIFCSPHIGHO2_12_FULL_49_9]|nr:MAG: hypothetical protein A3E80_06825 [Chlamydiae bacterium RIFCSPHIGHO2_12_FULL_49_9]